jgi:hypothetical protein
MKSLLLLTLLSMNVEAQEMKIEDAINTLEQHQEVLNKVAVGDQVVDEKYESHGTCVFYQKVVSTILEINSDGAKVLKEQSSIDKCTGATTSKKYLTHNRLIQFALARPLMKEFFKDYLINLKGNILTFDKTLATGDRFIYQYDLRFSLFANWVHHHHSFTGVEDHNIKNPITRPVATTADIQNLETCELDAFTQEVLGCK